MTLKLPLLPKTVGSLKGWVSDFCICMSLEIFTKKILRVIQQVANTMLDFPFLVHVSIQTSQISQNFYLIQEIVFKKTSSRRNLSKTLKRELWTISRHKTLP